MLWNNSEFQSTLLVRGATGVDAPNVQQKVFQSTLLVRGATCLFLIQLPKDAHFNPRSSWEERPQHLASSVASFMISIHAPRERSDKIPHRPNGEVLQFQSTLLVRGATLSLRYALLFALFQSTLLVRGATLSILWFLCSYSISIHAPRERSDHQYFIQWQLPWYFNPRSSWEERPH